MIGYQFLQSRWLLLLAPLFLVGCNSGGGGGGGGGTDLAGVVAEADGFAQKGPFQVGGTALIQPLAEDGTTTGEGIETDIGQAGEFRFEDIDWFGPSLITVTGDWFNESAGNFAGQPITLRSVVAIPDPDDDDAESPFPTSVNLLTEAMTDLVLTRLDNGSSFDGSVTLANNRLNEALGLDGDVRALNLFALDSQHPLERQVSGVFAKIMIALSARDDLADIVETAGNSAWSGNVVDDVFADLWQELRDEAAEMLEDGGIEAARTLLANNYGGVEQSRQLTNQGPLAVTFACNPSATDQFGNARLCPGTTPVSLGPNEVRVFRFIAPHDGAFRFSATQPSTRTLAIHSSLNDQGQAAGSPLENCLQGCGTAVGTDILAEGTERFIRIQNVSGNNLQLNITAFRLNAGSPQNPQWIFPDRSVSAFFVGQSFTLVAGSRSLGEASIDSAPISNDHTYVRFTLPAGLSRVNVDQSPCQVLNGSSRAYLYRAPNGPVGNGFADQERFIALALGNDCTLQLDLEEPSAGDYLLKIVNRHTNVFGPTQPSGSTHSYHVYAN